MRLPPPFVSPTFFLFYPGLCPKFPTCPLFGELFPPPIISLILQSLITMLSVPPDPSGGYCLFPPPPAFSFVNCSCQALSRSLKTCCRGPIPLFSSDQTPPSLFSGNPGTFARHPLRVFVSGRPLPLFFLLDARLDSPSFFSESTP